jgi:purine-binding chemotaxis protein CheW
MPETLTIADSYIVFELAGAVYGVPSQLVRQMEMLERVTPVPNAPAYVEGVTSSRGAMIPVINLRSRFGFEKIPATLRTRLLVVQAGGRTVGWVVDSAREFVRIAPEAVQPPPDTIAGLSGTYLKGIAKLGDRLVLVLNVEEVINSVEKISMTTDHVDKV